MKESGITEGRLRDLPLEAFKAKYVAWCALKHQQHKYSIEHLSIRDLREYCAFLHERERRGAQLTLF